MIELRKKEEMKFIKKVETVVRKKLVYMLEYEEWTGTEIAKKYNFASNRQTEIKNPGKYPKGGLNKKLLATLLRENFVTISEIIDKTDLTTREKEHLRRFEIFEDGRMQRMYLKAKDEGGNPADIVEKWILDKEKGDK